jgi:LmbE family N-acetylglucosaminyl deacetylase/glycosyltransferase involved in cell wall biosynthesis
MADPLVPPGETSEVRARRALVLAPHFDDDVFGCGGLIANLVDGGARVRVVFLTDSAGGDELPDAGPDYARRRREEATRALAILGVTDIGFADLPDGDLENHVERCADAIRAELLDERPDLLLSVGPLEVTRDHRAAFASLHAVFTGLRGGTPLDDVAAGLRILLYDVNHTGYVDLLVDVGDQLERIEKAVRCHASQLELHDYLGAAVGIRRWRTYSLPPAVTAAEGFRELTARDLTARSLAGAIDWLGGAPRLTAITDGPLVSVIVRTRDRHELLAEALASLARQSWRRTEVVLVNDGGVPPSIDDDYPLDVVRVDLEPSRGRAGAANAGIAAAHGDWISFLDDDDLAEPEHLETLVGVARAAGVRVAYTDAAVSIHELDPDQGWREVERRLPYSRDFDPDLLVLDNYIPFNTVLVDRSLLVEVGPLEESLPFFEDWDLLIRLSERSPFHHLARVTCEYRHFRSGAHHVFGEHPSWRADFLEVKASVIDRHRARIGPDVLARAVGRLREEAVVNAEAAEVRRRELESARSELSARIDAWHRLNGEREGLTRSLAATEADRDAHRTHATELEAELDRVRSEEKRLTDALAASDERVGRTHAEIEHLNAVIREMQSTTAWRWKRRLNRLLGGS